MLIHLTAITDTNRIPGTSPETNIRCELENALPYPFPQGIDPPIALPASAITDTAFTANWQSVPAATAYRLDVSEAQDFSTLVPGYDNLAVSGTTHAVTGLHPGTDYYYRIRATKGTDVSPNSSVISSLTIPAAPTLEPATDITDTSFTANWQAVQGASEYRLDISTSSDFSTYLPGYQDLTVSGLSQAVTGLVSGSSYYSRVRAVNATGASDNSNVITASPYAPRATGGNKIVLHNGKWYHIFTTSGIFTPQAPIDCEYILVAGGGSGGKGGHPANAAGGGGAGGVLPSTDSETFHAQDYNVVIGAGGKPVAGDAYAPKDGNNSAFLTPSGTKTAKKGGKGGSRSVAGTPIESQKTNYGSGSGAGSVGVGGYAGGYGNNTEDQGRNGGATQSIYGGKGGAGGGFTEDGESPSSNAVGTTGAKGGAGTMLEAIWSDVSAAMIEFTAIADGFAGGGNGGFTTLYVDPVTSNGGGLGGKAGRNSGNGSPASQSTGSGGGGGADAAGVGGDGADGFLIVRYAA